MVPGFSDAIAHGLVVDGLMMFTYPGITSYISPWISAVFRDFLCFKCIPQVLAMSFEISQGFQVQRNLKSALLLAFVILGMALWLEQGVPSRKLKRQ